MHAPEVWAAPEVYALGFRWQLGSKPGSMHLARLRVDPGCRPDPKRVDRRPGSGGLVGVLHLHAGVWSASWIHAPRVWAASWIYTSVVESGRRPDLVWSAFWIYAPVVWVTSWIYAPGPRGKPGLGGVLDLHAQINIERAFAF